MKRKDKIAKFIVDQMPARLVYWAAATVLYHATMGKYNHTVVPDITAMEAMKRYGEDKKIV